MAKVEEKQIIVNEINEKLEKSSSAVVVDALGLSVEQDTV
ncbi:MAG: 50S ribosomal protein L10, partial [Firmicutes bacterium]|nr:50S ribosomal protein L10 [Bacillota bacterium]